MVQGKEKNERIKGRRRESPPPIKGCGLFTEGMDEHGANSRDVRRLERPQQGVAQHACADALTRIPPVHRQAGQDHDGNGLWHVAFNGACHKAVLDVADGQGVVADDRVAKTDHIGAGCAGALVFHCPMSQPVTQ